MKLNLFRRSLIFATFFGCCLCVSLLAAALGTRHWLEVRARRSSNPLESDGRVSLGLFDGRKELNPGYGWRTYEFSVKSGTHPARRWAWIGTAGLLGAALVAAAGGALLAALNTAARPHSRAAALPALYVTNGLTVTLSLGALAVWLTEYYLRLQHNVMSDEELSNMWTSDGLAEFGYSFWLVVAAGACALGNIVCVLVGALDARDAAVAAPPLQDKLSGAIMLY